MFPITHDPIQGIFRNVAVKHCMCEMGLRQTQEQFETTVGFGIMYNLYCQHTAADFKPHLSALHSKAVDTIYHLFCIRVVLPSALQGCAVRAQ